eukprot:TRINITY_DN14366_c0_g2_i1.p1 TRINITY_DN14366_c0_g2~~TRINITY_DN14366_c0_g2_i1.p1  ORF type:complete len:318 (+),score=16.91 TRINITY_DN14366_c0_g2_i1:66-1019(+)
MQGLIDHSSGGSCSPDTKHRLEREQVMQCRYDSFRCQAQEAAPRFHASSCEWNMRREKEAGLSGVWSVSHVTFHVCFLAPGPFLRTGEFGQASTLHNAGLYSASHGAGLSEAWGPRRDQYFPPMREMQPVDELTSRTYAGAGRRLQQEKLPAAAAMDPRRGDRGADAVSASPSFLSGGLPLTPPPSVSEAYKSQFEWRHVCADDCPICRVVTSSDESDGEWEEPDGWKPFSGRPEVWQTSDGGSPLLGSAGHETGACRPCAHFWRAGGCHRESDCERCHLCPPGAFERYRRKGPGKRSKLKRRERERGVNGMEGGSP